MFLWESRIQEVKDLIVVFIVRDKEVSIKVDGKALSGIQEMVAKIENYFFSIDLETKNFI